jgi:hypothetical protein
MLSPEWLSAVAPVGATVAPNAWAAFGACTFFNRHRVLWLVTANHVVNSIGNAALSVFVGRQPPDGVAVIEVGKILADNGLDWVRNTEGDLAAAPMPVTAEPLSLGIKWIGADACLELGKLSPSLPCVTIGCPFGLPGVDLTRSTPLVLGGIIAGVDPHTRRVYTSAPTFPGNSGGPLVVMQSPYKEIGGGIQFVMGGGRRTTLLAGIMLEMHLVWPPNPDDRTPPLHLGVAAPTDAIISLLDSEPAQAIVSKIRNIISEQGPN